MKTRLKDISEDTGYSISTVSRVLSGHEGISTKAREEVLRSAKRLNYPIQNMPNDAFADEPMDILLLTGFEVGEFYASYFDGFNKAASGEEVTLNHISFGENRISPETVLEKLDEDNYDGLIINIPSFNADDYKKLVSELPEDFPIVSNAALENQVVHTVSFDNFGGGFLVAQHLHEQGYTSCGIIHGPKGLESRQRAHGYKDFIAASDNMELVWQVDGDYTFEAGLNAFAEFDKLENKPQAVFACNDTMCHAFIKEAQVNGYKIPEDLAIVGYDDLPICKNHRPTITSVHTSYRRLGQTTIGLLDALQDQDRYGKLGNERGVFTLVPVSIKTRNSS